MLNYVSKKCLVIKSFKNLIYIAKHNVLIYNTILSALIPLMQFNVNTYNASLLCLT